LSRASRPGSKAFADLNYNLRSIMPVLQSAFVCANLRRAYARASIIVYLRKSTASFCSSHAFQVALFSTTATLKKSAPISVNQRQIFFCYSSVTTS
jgi:hypothetical protein